MEDVPVPGFKKFWADKLSTLKSEYPALVNKYPDSDALIKQVYKVLCDIEDFAVYTPPLVGESSDWTSVVDSAEENRANYCKVQSGKTQRFPRSQQFQPQHPRV
jgi:hypothetical protein